MIFLLGFQIVLIFKNWSLVKDMLFRIQPLDFQRLTCFTWNNDVAVRPPFGNRGKLVSECPTEGRLLRRVKFSQLHNYILIKFT